MSESAGLTYLQTFPDFELGTVSPGVAFGLGRVLALLDEVGAPQMRLPVIHLAGTKGKGSTAAMVAAIMRAAGVRAGLFTQPHLVRLHERFQIDGQQIGDEALTEIMLGTIRPAVDRLARRGITGVQKFEAQVALALLWFEAAGASIVVLETGLGGRLDATNVVPRPLCVVLTSIGHDHTQVLGDTLPLIAAEKAAIIKDGVQVVSAVQDPAVVPVFEAACAAHHAPLLLGGRNWSVEVTAADPRGTSFTLRCQALSGVRLDDEGQQSASDGQLALNLRTRLAGPHQAMNAGMAALAALLVQKSFPRIDLTAVRKGLARVEWPGRLQVIGTDPLVVLDGAHTAESAMALASATQLLYGKHRLVLVCGIQGDKDIPAVVQPLAALAEAAVATQAAHPRAAPTGVIAGALRAAGCRQVEEVSEPVAALHRARVLAGSAGLVLVTGSLYLVGTILAAGEPRPGNLDQVTL